ncbi:MAG: hypothetical protein HOH19_12420 [Kordiimonadaceae bacterium]|nr:hypothetical protein [Kordiimonadaceae bacterium]MBT6033372.1 hypothetical protein [Kordiimonadaceae bacterium]
MPNDLDDFLIKYKEDTEKELNYIKYAHPISMRTTYTILDNPQFNGIIKKLRELDKSLISQKKNSRSSFNSYEHFLKHALVYLLAPTRRDYFSIPTGNLQGNTYNYKQVNKVIDLLCDQGWIEKVPQSIVYYATGVDAPQPRTRIKVREAAPTLIGDYKVETLKDVDCFVEITEPSDNDSKGCYKDKEYTDEMRDEDEELLKNYNDLMASTIIRDQDGNIFHWLNPLVRKVSRKDYPFYNKRVQGISGGRFWGPLILNMPEEDRLNHTFNGETIAEVDIKKCHPQLAFHMKGCPTPVLDDLYELPKAIESRHDYKKIKKVFLRIFNMANKRSWLNILDELFGVPTTEGEKLLKRFTPIEDMLFNKNIGHQLRWIESQLVRGVLEKAEAEQVPVIPIHDSFLVPKDKVPWLRKVLNATYHSKYASPKYLESVTIGEDKVFHNMLQTTVEYSTLEVDDNTVTQ